MGCLDPARCNPAAHGNVVMLQGCTRCTSIRDVLVNGPHQEPGPWRQDEDDRDSWLSLRGGGGR